MIIGEKIGGNHREKHEENVRTPCPACISSSSLSSAFPCIYGSCDPFETEKKSRGKTGVDPPLLARLVARLFNL